MITNILNTKVTNRSYIWEQWVKSCVWRQAEQSTPHWDSWVGGGLTLTSFITVVIVIVIISCCCYCHNYFHSLSLKRLKNDLGQGTKYRDVFTCFWKKRKKVFKNTCLLEKHLKIFIQGCFPKILSSYFSIFSKYN